MTTQKALWLKSKLTKQITLLILAMMYLLFSITINNFFSVNNIRNIFSSFVIYGVVAIAMTFAIICGEFDLSVGSIMALSSLAFAKQIETKPMLAAMLISLALGAVTGAVNGLIIAKLKVPSFVVTLGMMIIVKGAALYYTDAQPVPIYDDLSYQIGNGTVLGIPYLVLAFLALMVLAWFVLRYTSFGRNLYAVGGNYEAAKYAGINVDFYKFMIFVILGVASSFSGIMMAWRITAGNALYGADLTMSAISAVVVGGTSLNGGSGGVWRTFVGLIVLYTLYNALTLLGVQAYVQQLIKGLIVITVIAVDGVIRLSNEQ